MSDVRPTFDAARRLAWLRLWRSENIGPRTFQSLLTRYGSAEAALEALPDLVKRQQPGRPIRIATLAEIEAEMAVAQKLGARFLCRDEAGYPPLLREIDSPPAVIALRGQASVLDKPAIAIVGARNASRRRPRLRRAPRPRAGAGGLRDRLRLRARHRQPGASREPADRHDRRARRRPRQALSGRPGPVHGADSGGRRGALRDAVRLGGARPRFSTPQPAGLRPLARGGRGRGGAPLGLAHHRALRGRAGARSVCRTRLAARSPGGRYQRPDPRRRHLLRRHRRHFAGAGRSHTARRPARRCRQERRAAAVRRARPVRRARHAAARRPVRRARGRRRPPGSPRTRGRRSNALSSDSARRRSRWTSWRARPTFRSARCAPRSWSSSSPAASSATAAGWFRC